MEIEKLTEELDKARNHITRAMMCMEKDTEGFRAICRVRIIISGILFDHLEVRKVADRIFRKKLKERNYKDTLKREKDK